MEHILADLTAQHARLDDILGTLDDRGWSTPSRCDGWTVADVVLHLAQTDELAVASVTDTFGGAMVDFTLGMDLAENVDDGAGLAVERQRGQPPAVVLDRWRTGSTALVAALAEADPSARVPWVVGDMACRTLATTRLAECWIHTEDITVPLGTPDDPGDRLWAIARLAWRTLPYAFDRAGRPRPGPVAFVLTAPSGQEWRFAPAEPAATTVTGPALDLCRIAGQRLAASDSALEVEGPDGPDVLELVRTFA